MLLVLILLKNPFSMKEYHHHSSSSGVVTCPHPRSNPNTAHLRRQSDIAAATTLLAHPHSDYSRSPGTQSLSNSTIYNYAFPSSTADHPASRC